MEIENLDRFIKAQENHYHKALSEIRQGKKRSHWMWFVYPQVKGLGMSQASIYYGIKDLKEAELFLHDPVLGKRLVDISNALLDLSTNNAASIFGSPDDLKLRSCMTLFSQIPGAPAVFQKVLDKFFQGIKDSKTMDLIK